MVHFAAHDSLLSLAHTLLMERHSAYRTNGTPTYTTVGKERELRVLKLLARYNLLPSSYIYHELGNYKATCATLTNLTKGNYIGLPDLPRDEKLAYIPRNTFYVFELKPRGRTLLADLDLVTQGGNDHYKHRLLRSEVEFLLDRVPLSVKGPADILGHDACPPHTKDASYPFRIPPKPSLEPDITRGFGDGDTFMFFHIEIDRGTEPVLSQNARQSIGSKIGRYVQYLNAGAYETHFGFRVPPSVLFMTTRENLASLLALFPKEKWRDRFYALTVPPKPLPTHNLLVPWQGVDGTLDLMEMFNERNRKSGSHSRTG